MTAELHTLTESCWCQPLTALDGHVNEDGSPVEFAATDLDPVDRAGFIVETERPRRQKESPLGVWFDAAPFDGWSEYAYMDSEEHP